MLPTFKQRLCALTHKRDVYAGGLMVLIGLVVALQAPSYRTGTLMHMGPGFFPTVLGVILVFLGLLIAGSALASPAGEGEDERVLPAAPQWRGWSCILLGPILFILLGQHGGMIPATFACVFVSAFGDRGTTWKGALVLALGVTVFGVIVFSWLLQIPFPLLTWRVT